MKTYRFRSVAYVEAENEEEAREEFSSNSFYFAAEADVEEFSSFNEALQG